VVVVELLRLGGRVLALHLAAQETLRERRPVIGQGVLLRQQSDLAAAAGRAVFLDRPRRREPAAQDD
jgi:hypothetical protein